jgi:hypothetical protein
MILYFVKGRDHRCVDAVAATCLYRWQGAWRLVPLACATIYAVRLVEAGWRLVSLDEQGSMAG